MIRARFLVRIHFIYHARHLKVVMGSFCRFGDLFKDVFISLYNGHLWLWWAPVKSKLIINPGITKPKIINRYLGHFPSQTIFSLQRFLEWERFLFLDSGDRWSAEDWRRIQCWFTIRAFTLIYLTVATQTLESTTKTLHHYERMTWQDIMMGWKYFNIQSTSLLTITAILISIFSKVSTWPYSLIDFNCDPLWFLWSVIIFLFPWRSRAPCCRGPSTTLYWYDLVLLKIAVPQNGSCMMWVRLGERGCRTGSTSDV